MGLGHIVDRGLKKLHVPRKIRRLSRLAHNPVRYIQRHGSKHGKSKNFLVGGLDNIAYAYSKVDLPHVYRKLVERLGRISMGSNSAKTRSQAVATSPYRYRLDTRYRSLSDLTS